MFHFLNFGFFSERCHLPVFLKLVIRIYYKFFFGFVYFHCCGPVLFFVGNSIFLLNPLCLILIGRIHLQSLLFLLWLLFCFSVSYRVFPFFVLVLLFFFSFCDYIFRCCVFPIFPLISVLFIHFNCFIQFHFFVSLICLGVSCLLLRS